MRQATLYHLHSETVAVVGNIIEYAIFANSGGQAILCDNSHDVIASSIEQHKLPIYNFVEEKYDQYKRKVVAKESFIAMSPEVEEVLRTVLVAKYTEKIEALEKQLQVSESRAANYFLGHKAYIRFISLPWWKRLFYKGGNK